MPTAARIVEVLSQPFELTQASDPERVTAYVSGSVGSGHGDAIVVGYVRRLNVSFLRLDRSDPVRQILCLLLRCLVLRMCLCEY